MFWIISVSGLLALIIFLLLSNRIERQRKTFEKIRSSWGKPKKEPLSFDRIAAGYPSDGLVVGLI